MKQSELISDIADLKEGINSPATPENLKEGMRETLAELQEKLAAMNKKGAGKQSPAAGGSKKKKKKTPSSLVPRPPRPKESIIFEGKTINEGDADYCEKLLSAWASRREKAKKASKKYRTEPVMRKVSRDVVDSVQKAIQNVPAAEIKDDPKAFAKDAINLETAAKAFLQAFRAILGSDYKKEEIDKEFAPLEALINGLVKKFGSKKKMARGGKVGYTLVTEAGSRNFTNEQKEEAIKAFYKLKDKGREAYLYEGESVFKKSDDENVAQSILAKGGSIPDVEIIPNPDYKYQNIAKRWLEDIKKDSLKYKAAALFLSGKNNPDEILGIEDQDKYDRILRSLDSISESKNEMSWRTNNYNTSEAERWAKESLQEMFILK